MSGNKQILLLLIKQSLFGIALEKPYQYKVRNPDPKAQIERK